MANSKLLVSFIKSWEAGYVNDPLDKGGETNMGITIGTWKHAGFNCSEKIPSVIEKDYSGRPVIYTNVTKTLYEMTEEQWHQVFKSMYWDRWRADQVNSQSIANILVDWLWASGVWGIKIPQRLLGLKEDGIVGSLTLSAVNSREPRSFFEEIKQARVKYIDDICKKTPTNERFRKGWLNRINSLQFNL